MKLSTVPSPQHKAESRITGEARPFGLWTLDFGLKRRDGVALVITLIMLSIITFMAVTFLVLSQRELKSVAGTTDQKIARNANDSALARVSTELITHMLLRSNFQDFDLLVSTNYINQAGLFPGVPGNLNPTNVNYDYLVGAGHPPITSAQDRNINIASLLFNPRPPVFVVTNLGTGAGEFRFYMDLNRNGRFDTNGSLPVISSDPTHPYFNATNGELELPAYLGQGPIVSNYFVGDPEWIGVLERPEELHSADNRFIARYAYIVIPSGKTLDMNYIHNRAKRISFNGEGFLRNQGVGTWEINLAAFLADLNTNAWWNVAPGYIYNTNSGFASIGSAFTNANDFLTYRYGINGYANLFPANAILPPVAPPLFARLASYNIDLYSDGPLMLNTTNTANAIPDDPTLPWSGSDNSNHFFSTQDPFSQTPPGFRTVLSNLGTSNDSYNAYTFYRMLAQLGTDSATDRNKLNVNFKNTDTNSIVVPGLETNLVSWTPLDFFTNAATAMFQQLNMRDFNGNLVTITNIPIYEDPVTTLHTNLNYYTPAVHRILQLAANMYDATTNRVIGGGATNYPSVFRPVFRSQGGIATIVGYEEVGDLSGTAPAFFPFLDPTNFVKTPQPLNRTINLYGVPWVIGAKKGFPNFNEFSMENPLTVSRKLQFTNSVARPPWITNQIFDFAITNSFGIEAWNSYTNAYGRSLRMVVSNEMSIVITNEIGFPLLNVTSLAFGSDSSFTGWPGWNERLKDINSFKVPVYVSQIYTNGIYQKNAPFLIPLAPPVWDATFVPHLWMNLQFKLRFVLIDTTANRIIDFVNVASTQPPVDIAARLDNTANGRMNSADLDEQWDTNRLGNVITGVPVGIMNQINASLGGVKMSDWIDTPANIAAAQSNFRRDLNNAVTNNFQAPYTPHRTIFQRISLQANDPLVHYTAADLTSTNGQQAQYNQVELNAKNPPLPNLTNVNFAYQPWGGYHLPGGSPQNGNQFDYNYNVKDTMVEQSDNWDFPTNKLANIGWLGRIHRGTPWQTIDMKPSNLSADDWRTWANDNVLLTNGNFVMVDAALTHPAADYGLFDLFTTAINENASAGRLNVNQTNLAAWSAVLSGVNVITNTPTGPQPFVINPAGVYDPTNPTAVAAIVQAINATRANTNSAKGALQVFKDGYFQHAGDVLATPQLSVASPFINTNGLNSLGANGVNDEIMERIPQQIMSLLTLNQTPRFVIYSFGQTLHPADHSLVIGGTFNGLCTNYQITAESATRAVVRVEGTPDPQYTNDVVHPHPDALGRFYPPRVVVEQFNVLGPD